MLYCIRRTTSSCHLILHMSVRRIQERVQNERRMLIGSRLRLHVLLTNVLPLSFYSPIWKGHMTRDFDKQRRDDMRPSSRNYSSGRYGEERPPRPARPRLNRAAVDRGWETGAQQNHADYRPRSRNNGNAGQPARDYGRHNQQFDHPSAQKGRNPNGRRPYENRQDNYRHDNRSAGSNRGPRARSYDSDRRNVDEQRYGERRGYSDRYRDRGESGPRRDYRHNTEYSGERPSYRDRDARRGYSQRGYAGDNRQRRDFEREHRSPRSYDRNYGSDRHDSRSDSRNPRWQSRPQRGNYSRPVQPYTSPATSEDELYEGDYEQYNAPESSRYPREQQRQHEENTGQTDERHVTRLPDGRVLKGPRRVQRKDAKFWTDVAQESDALVSDVKPVTPPDEARSEVSDRPMRRVTTPRKSTKPKPAAAPKPRARKASQVARDRKSRGKVSTPKARTTGLKPSQRGFKWPKP